MRLSFNDISQELPPEDRIDYRGLNKTLFKNAQKTCIIIDDDPTGNQTVYDIPLLAKWDVDTLIYEFDRKTPVFFILTNSRSLSQEKSTAIYKEISANIYKASNSTGRNFSVISRSDSTLRGHFSEIDALKQSGDFENAIHVFIPVMFEGGRVTLHNVHYIKENGTLLPVSETTFAKDHTFGYSHANLKLYIEEKTKGAVTVEDIVSIDIKTLRTTDVETLSFKINAVGPGKYCIFNTLNYYDLDKVTHALLLAENLGKKMIYRTSSSFIPSYIGQLPNSLLRSNSLINSDHKKGGLIVVGSYVSKSTSQLTQVLENANDKTIIELDINSVLSDASKSYLNSIISNIDSSIEDGKDVVLYTSRKLITGKDTSATIEIASTVSQALVDLVNGIQVRPKYIIAKGGITSHDLAVRGLNMIRSKVLGQILPGIPVWEMGEETKFPGLAYIVFPGNVGDENSLLELIQKLS